MLQHRLQTDDCLYAVDYIQLAVYGADIIANGPFGNAQLRRDFPVACSFHEQKGYAFPARQNKTT
ncbi:hypothetical protein GCM10020370_52780 [Paenibacillus hodogayensis]